jgi:hypothetical protein
MNRRVAGVALAALSFGSLAGCVEQRYVITSDPPGAVVLRNNQPIGATPADDHFVYYGNYHFTLIKDGYSTLQVDQKIPAPWYEIFPLDFFSETLVPFRIRDVRRFNYHLEPVPAVNTEQLLTRAQGLRDRGLSIGSPQPPVPAPLPVPAPPPAPGQEVLPPANPLPSAPPAARP